MSYYQTRRMWYETITHIPYLSGIARTIQSKPPEKRIAVKTFLIIKVKTFQAKLKQWNIPLEYLPHAHKVLIMPPRLLPSILKEFTMLSEVSSPKHEEMFTIPSEYLPFIHKVRYIIPLPYSGDKKALTIPPKYLPAVQTQKVGFTVPTECASVIYEGTFTLQPGYLPATREEEFVIPLAYLAIDKKEIATSILPPLAYLQAAQKELFVKSKEYMPIVDNIDEIRLAGGYVTCLPKYPTIPHITSVGNKRSYSKKVKQPPAPVKKTKVEGKSAREARFEKLKKVIKDKYEVKEEVVKKPKV